MATTDDLVYPVLLVGKHGIYRWYDSKGTLAEDSDKLSSFNRVDWLFFIDSQFVEYRVKHFTKLTGFGRFGGYYFQGPFLKRRVMFRAELESKRQATIQDVAGRFLKTIQEADLSSEETAEVEAKIKSVTRTDGATLKALVSAFFD